MTPTETSNSLLAAASSNDPIVQGVLYTLLALSLITWFLIVYKALELWRARRANAEYAQQFWVSSNAIAYLQETAAQQTNPLAQLAASGWKALEHYASHQGGAAQVGSNLVDTLTRALRQTIQDQTTHFEAGLGTLATIGNTAPFIGLFGTVIGIMSALQSIAASGSADLQVVAGPIGEALIATAAGIACAVPAVVGYNSFLRRLKVMGNTLDSFAFDVLGHLASERAVQAVTAQWAAPVQETR